MILLSPSRPNLITEAISILSSFPAYKTGLVRKYIKNEPELCLWNFYLEFRNKNNTKPDYFLCLEMNEDESKITIIDFYYKIFVSDKKKIQILKKPSSNIGINQDRFYLKTIINLIALKYFPKWNWGCNIMSIYKNPKKKTFSLKEKDDVTALIKYILNP